MRFGNTLLDQKIGKLIVDFRYKQNIERTIFESLRNYHIHFPLLKKHSEVIGFIGLKVAERLGCDSKKEMALNLLHDVGKLSDLEFFLKLSRSKTKPLAAEYERIKLHTFHGYKFLMERGHLFCAHGAAWHHRFRNIDPYGPEVYDIENLEGETGRELKECCWRLGLYDFMEAFLTRDSENVHGVCLSQRPEDKCERLKLSLESMYGTDEVIGISLEVCYEFIDSLIQWS